MNGGLRQVTAAATAAALWIALCAAYVAFADAPRSHERVIFASVDDVMVQTLSDDLKAEIDHETERELMLEIQVESGDGLPDVDIEIVDVSDDGHCEPCYEPAEVQGDPDGLNSFHGTFKYNGKTETFYANYAAYDDQLTVDEEGFFRDDQGRYVVDSSEYPEGTEIEISKGTAVVMDGGASPGVVDVHTVWGR